MFRTDCTAAPAPYPLSALEKYNKINSFVIAGNSVQTFMRNKYTSQIKLNCKSIWSFNSYFDFSNIIPGHLSVQISYKRGAKTNKIIKVSMPTRHSARNPTLIAMKRFYLNSSDYTVVDGKRALWNKYGMRKVIPSYLRKKCSFRVFLQSMKQWTWTTELICTTLYISITREQRVIKSRCLLDHFTVFLFNRNKVLRSSRESGWACTKCPS